MRSLRFLRWWLGGGTALLLAIVYLTLAPTAPGIPVLYGDKIGHLLGYFVLMSWFCGQVLPRRRWWLACALMTLGVVLELLQGMMGVRGMEVVDMAANALGVALGWLGAVLGLAGWSTWLEQLLARVTALPND